MDVVEVRFELVRSEHKELKLLAVRRELTLRELLTELVRAAIADARRADAGGGG